MNDASHMHAALALARRGLGSCWPNPSVGCVIVRDGRVVGRGVTAQGGRPHAETQALAMAGPAARGATVFVTLEPCCHHGATPPCTAALTEAGVARIFVALRDCDPRMNGAGIARLRGAGIVVEEGLLGAEAADVSAGFFSRIQNGRPLVTLKLASSLDGRIATSAGHSRWITGPAARREVQALRGRNDAVMVGIGTVLADDPDLTTRLDGFRTRPPVRVVADSTLRTPTAARLVTTATQTPTWILASAEADPAQRDRLALAGAQVLTVPQGAAGLDMSAALHSLGDRGLTRLLVEGGAKLAGALLAADLVDRIAWFHAPGIIGGDGLSAAAAFGVTDLAAMPRFVRENSRPVGDDMLIELRRAA